MKPTASIRDLRNRFPRVRELVDTEGEVLLTERGVPRYRLVRYDGSPGAVEPAPKDYLARLKRHQPRAMSAAEARALDEENRGGR